MSRIAELCMGKVRDSAKNGSLVSYDTKLLSSCADGACFHLHLSKEEAEQQTEDTNPGPMDPFHDGHVGRG